MIHIIINRTFETVKSPTGDHLIELVEQVLMCAKNCHKNYREFVMNVQQVKLTHTTAPPTQVILRSTQWF